jgi:hypothetical protein
VEIAVPGKHALRGFHESEMVLMGDQRGDVGRDPCLWGKAQPGPNAQPGSLPSKIEVDPGVYHADAFGPDTVGHQDPGDRIRDGNDPLGSLPIAAPAEVKIHSSRGDQGNPGQAGANTCEGERVRIVGMEDGRTDLQSGENRPDHPGIYSGPPRSEPDNYAG